VLTALGVLRMLPVLQRLGAWRCLRFLVVDCSMSIFSVFIVAYKQFPSAKKPKFSTATFSVTANSFIFNGTTNDTVSKSGTNIFSRTQLYTSRHQSKNGLRHGPPEWQAPQMT